MNNSMEGKSPKQIFNTVKIMHLAICTGPLIFAIAMAYLVSLGESFGVTGISSTLILLIAVLLFVTGIFLSNILYKKKIDTIIESYNIKDKFAIFTGAFILKLALLEAPALLCVVGFMLTADYKLLIPVGIILLFMYFSAPTLSKLTNDLKLTPDQIKELS
ncbi:MAG: hypothetical protein IPP08_07855 [Chlorobiota bacterium]|nr:hypothetical protein [Chlorobiota bacterium]QQS65691.1 MAG: hypothetical protein IPP08_07855 [Chlorobiota bacterium]